VSQAYINIGEKLKGNQELTIYRCFSTCILDILCVHISTVVPKINGFHWVPRFPPPIKLTYLVYNIRHEIHISKNVVVSQAYINIGEKLKGNQELTIYAHIYYWHQDIERRHNEGEGITQKTETRRRG
jgi:hypothetical protein